MTGLLSYNNVSYNNIYLIDFTNKVLAAVLVCKHETGL